MRKLRVIAPHGEYILELMYDRVVTWDQLTNVNTFYYKSEVVAVIPQNCIICLLEPEAPIVNNNDTHP